MDEILVVDDDPRLRELVRYVLERAGFAVREAGDGAGALDAIARKRPDLVLLDVLMPELDGISVCRRLNGEVPVVFLSSRGEEVDRVLGLDLGGDDYLAKPFAPAELVSRVRAVLRRASPRKLPVESGGVRLDPAAHRGWAGANELALTPTQFRMLHSLLSRPGNVVRRAELVRLAYEGPHHVSGRTLDSHMRGVRAELRRYDADRISTIAGVGWRWEA